MDTGTAIISRNNLYKHVNDGWCFAIVFDIDESLENTLVNYVYHKMLLYKNETYLVHVAKQILLVTISNVYCNNISLSIH